jgi:acetyltransferase-like isoleucine patch superfamily enzyme
MLPNNSIIGSQTVLNGYSKIGERTRINTGCALPQSMRIGKGVFVAPLVTFSDNKRALPGEGNQGAVIEDFVRIGIGAKILPKITIRRGAFIGAGAIVTRDIPERAIVYGAPAEIRDYLKEEDLDKYVDSITKWV